MWRSSQIAPTDGHGTMALAVGRKGPGSVEERSAHVVSVGEGGLGSVAADGLQSVEIVYGVCGLLG